MSDESTPRPAPSQESFIVQDRVAIGTAGVVYRALRSGTQEEVTFKVLSSRATHPLEFARVVALSWRLEALQHPVVARLIDEYEDPEGFVIVTNWIGGGLGANEFPRKRRKLTKQEAHFVALSLCDALLAGESQRFPHGDLKPSNIVLAERAQGVEIQIQDWGLSACREDQPPETLQFMAPERYHGHPASMQGDLFTAGATLWFLLTGDPPAYGRTPEEVQQSWGSFDAASLAQKRPDLDEHFRQWLTWILYWQPKDRPKSVAQALDVLNQVVDYATAIEARPTEPVPYATEVKAPRPVVVKLQLPVVSAGPPTSRRSAAPAAPKSSKPSKPKANVGQRLMALLMVVCVIVGLGIAFVAWAQNHYGHDWKHQVADDWHRLFAKEPAPLAATPTPAPAPPAAPVAAKGKPAPPPVKPVNPAAPKPAPPPVKPPAAGPFAVDRFEGTGDLNGRASGAGWLGPWQAAQISVEGNQAVLGKGASSAATRPLGPLKNVIADVVVLSLRVAHPGKDAGPFKFDLLSADGKTLVAPACVAFENGKLFVSIEGAKEKMEAPVGQPFQLVVLWNWKIKKADGKRQVTITAWVNPDINPQKALKGPLSRGALAEQMLPANFTLVLRCEGGAQPVGVADIRLGCAWRDAFP